MISTAEYPQVTVSEDALKGSPGVVWLKCWNLCGDSHPQYEGWESYLALVTLKAGCGLVLTKALEVQLPELWYGST